MSDDTFEDNLRRLVRAAPPRERLTPAQRARILSRLKDEWTEPLVTGDAHGPQAKDSSPFGRPLLPKLVLAAAALTLAVLGAYLVLRPQGGNPDRDQLATGESAAPTSPPGPAPRDGADGEQLRPSPDRNPNLVATLDGQDTGPREAVGAPMGQGTGGGHAGGESSDDRPFGDAKREDSIVGELSWPTEAPSKSASPRPEPGRWTIWVKPMVALPRVADPIAHDVSPVNKEVPGAAGQATFYLPDALSAARALGATEVLVQAEIPGYAPTTLVGSLQDLQVETLRFSPVPGVTITGSVTDGESGVPLPGAVVVAIDQVPLDALDVSVDPATERLPKPYCVTDSQGRFRLEDVRTGGTLRLRASAAGFAPLTLEPSPPRGSADGPTADFSLQRGSSVFGTVERDDGMRASGAAVVVSRIDGDPAAKIRPVMTYGRDIAGADGTYRVDDLPAGQYVALVFEDAEARTPAEYRQLQVGPSAELQVDFLSAVSTSELTLDGVFLDPMGQPLPGENLTLSTSHGRLAAQEDWRASETDEEGRFRFAGLEAGEVILHRSQDGFQTMSLVWIGRVNASQSLEVRLSGTEAWIAIDGLGPAAETSWVLLQRRVPEDDPVEGPDGAAWIYAGRTPASGSVPAGSAGAGLPGARFRDLAPGEYRAVVVGSDHGTTHGDPFQLAPRSKHSGLLTVVPGGPLNVWVVGDEEGHPRAGVRVTVLDSSGRACLQSAERLTNALGRTTVESVPHGPITIRLSDGSASLEVEEEFSPGPNDPGTQLQVLFPGS